MSTYHKTNHPGLSISEDGEVINDNGDILPENKIPKDIKDVSESILKDVDFTSAVKKAPKEMIDQAKKLLGWEAPESGVDFTQMEEGTGLPESALRFAAAVAKNPEEAKDYLNRESKSRNLGYEFELTKQSAGPPELVFKGKGDNQYRKVDAPFFSKFQATIPEMSADIAELIPETASMATTGVGAAYGGIPGAAISGALLEPVRNMAARTLGVTNDKIKKDETPAEFLKRVSPDTNSMLMDSLINSLGEGGGRYLLGKAEKKFFPKNIDSYVNAAGKTIERPLYPSERFGTMIGNPIENMNVALGSPYAKGLAKKESNMAKNILSGSEDYFSKKPLNLEELNLKLNESLKGDLKKASEYFQKEYTEIGKSLSPVANEPIDMSSVLNTINDLKVSNESELVKNKILKQLVQTNNVQKLYDTMRDLTKYDGILGGKAISKNGELKSIRDIVDTTFESEISKVAPDVAEQYDVLKNTYANQIETSNKLKKALKSETGAYSTVPKLSNEKMDILKASNIQKETGLDLPSEQSKEYFARGKAKQLGDMNISQGDINFPKLENFFKQPKEYGVFKEIMKNVGEEIIPGGSLNEPAKQAENYLNSINVLKNITMNPYSVSGRESLKAAPFSATESMLKFLGNLGNAPFSQFAYNPGGSLGRLALTSGAAPTGINTVQEIIDSLGNKK